MQSEDGEEGFVDTPEFFGGHVTFELAEAAGVNGTDLFHEDPRDLGTQGDFGTE